MNRGERCFLNRETKLEYVPSVPVLRHSRLRVLGFLSLGSNILGKALRFGTAGIGCPS